MSLQLTSAFLVSRAGRSVLKPRLQGCPGARQKRHDRADGNFDDLRDLFVRQILQFAQHEHFSCFGGQLLDGLLKLAAFGPPERSPCFSL